MLETVEDAQADVPISPPAPVVSHRLADMLRAARLDTNLETLRLLRVVSMRLPVPARRIDVLV